MCNLWWIVIALSICIVLIGIVITICCIYAEYKKDYYYKMSWKYISSYEYPDEREYKKAINEKENANRIYDRKINIEHFGNKLCWIFVPLIALVIIFTTITGIGVGASLCEYREFVETKQMVEDVYNGDYTQYENAGINIEIIELNKWLAHAKAEKQRFGDWSFYAGLDLDSLEYIKLTNIKE